MEKVWSVLNPQTDILGFIDNDEKRQQRMIKDKKVFSPDIVSCEEFDYIIVSAYTKYREISNQIENLGVDKQKIIQFYNYTRFFPRTFFYNDSVVRDDRYSELFVNFTDIRIGS